ncbi:MAG: DegT/DnrJ/EryC1/StrS family aminotransferase [Bdellovibrionales bacterium]|nr:DegT/DnrJ/EryC1/StrS family aminotransferase [Bdellovibrionales bacterium]
MPFLDLKTQYRALQTAINQRIQNVLEHGQFILGPEVEECEQKLAEFVKAKYAITCASGSDALMMALMALDLQQGDEIITTPFSFIATAEIPVLLGITPVFVDIEPGTFNIDPNKIEKAITPKTKAIIPVSLYGQPAEMDEINNLANKYNLFVIEDAAQSFGASYKERMSCNLSHIGCTSFFPAKPLGCYGDGGAIFTNDAKTALKLKEIRVHGQESRYFHTRLGINGRLDTLQCAILIPKLERFPWELEQRERIAQKYNKSFLHLESRLQLPKVIHDRTSAWAQYTIFVEERESLIQHLSRRSIPHSVHYPLPIHQQPAYKRWNNGPFPISERASKHVVSLPMYPDLNEENQDRVVEAVLEFFEN